ncbi:endonuclease domain-containing protein [Demequina sp.]|uniref:endonuclease domain-containing protein n=1 Tax=Demequina sp. TaxID=2050685 RepID=UPI003A868929
MPRLISTDRALAEFLTENQHAFTRNELLRGWSRQALETAMLDGSAQRILPGVYAASVHTQLPSVRGEALNLWHPRGLVTGELALHLFAPSLAPPLRSHLLVPGGHRPRVPPWVVCVQSHGSHAMSVAQGVSCAAPERALLDAWRYAPTHARQNLLWEALWARVCTWRQLRGELRRAPRVAGRRDLERMLVWFDTGATTPLEVRAQHETFADARFREFEWQVPVTLPVRRPMLDMLHRRTMVAVELDGDAYHATRNARDADRQRQTDLAAAGYVVLRFGWDDVTRRPAWCRERVLTTVAGRLARPGGT